MNTGSSYLFEYYLKDHLGNNRSGFGQGVNVTKPEFSADYYPFGMQYKEYVRAGSPKNNYLYNGKELQDGLKLYDYGETGSSPTISSSGVQEANAKLPSLPGGYGNAVASIHSHPTTVQQDGIAFIHSPLVDHLILIEVLLSNLALI